MAFASVAGGPIPIDPYSLSPPIMKNHVIKSFMYDSKSLILLVCKKNECLLHLACKYRAAMIESSCPWLLMLYHTLEGECKLWKLSEDLCLGRCSAPT